MANVLVVSMTKSIEDAVYHAEVNELEDYYNHLECGCMDVAHRKIGGKYFDIWVDDEGLLVENPVISAVTIAPDDEDGKPRFEPMLAGNLIIANHDAEGNTTSLSRADANMIIDNIIVRILEDGRKIPCLICEY